MKKLVFLFTLFTFFTAPYLAYASAPLFQQSSETFKILDANSKPPQFKLLASSVTKKSLAVALNGALKLGHSDSELKNYVEVKPEKVVFEVLKDKPSQLSVTLLVSGREFYLDPTISKAELMSGKKIQVKIPSQDYEVAMFTVTSRGEFTIQYQSVSDELKIDQAYAHFDIENPMTSEEPEQIRFSGKGIRQVTATKVK